MLCQLYSVRRVRPNVIGLYSQSYYYSTPVCYYRAEDSLRHVGIKVAENNPHVFFLQIHNIHITPLSLEVVVVTHWL